MHNDYSIEKGELHYRSIPPCIIAEQLLDAGKQPVPSSSLIDYKVWAFDGKPAYIWCCLNRTADSVEVITYDTEWNAHPEYSENNFRRNICPNGIKVLSLHPNCDRLWQKENTL